MATFNEAIFILSLIGLTGLFFYKLYNALSGFMNYDFKMSIVLWVASLFIYGLNFIISIMTYDNTLLNQMFKFMLLPLGMTTVLTIIEMFKNMQAAAESTQRGRYDPSKVNDLRARF